MHKVVSYIILYTYLDKLFYYTLNLKVIKGTYKYYICYEYNI